MPKDLYLCWVDYEPKHGPDHTLYAYRESDAAEDFAEYAHSNMDMWEAGEKWQIHVKKAAVEGPPNVYDIEVEHYPSFSATKKE